VGQALVAALAPLPFNVTWVDPRLEVFPAAVPENVMPVQTEDPVAALRGAEPASFVLVMTHSHALDFDLVEAALKDMRFSYVGLIGSATKRARFTARLRQSGLSDARIGNLVCPIGLPGIQSKHPAAIAAATVAQMLIVDERLRPQPARSKTSALRGACCADDVTATDMGQQPGTGNASLASACQSCAAHAASTTIDHGGK
jgi:xanthine dehydrogenase accessory factor